MHAGEHDPVELSEDEEVLEFDFTAYLARRLNADPSTADAVLGSLLMESHAARKAGQSGDPSFRRRAA